MNITTDELIASLKLILEQAEKRQENIDKAESEVIEENNNNADESKEDEEEAKRKAEEEIKKKISEIEEKQRILTEKVFNRIYEYNEEKILEFKMKQLDKQQEHEAMQEAVEEFDSYSFMDKFILRFKENRKEEGIIKSFFKAFRRNEKIDIRIHNDIQKAILEENQEKRQQEKEDLKNKVHSEMLKEYNQNTEKFNRLSVEEKQRYFETEVLRDFPEFKEEVLSLSEEIKKFDKEIDVQEESKENEKKEKEETPEEKTAEEPDELEV